MDSEGTNESQKNYTPPPDEVVEACCAVCLFQYCECYDYDDGLTYEPNTHDPRLAGERCMVDFDELALVGE